MKRFLLAIALLVAPIAAEAATAIVQQLTGKTPDASSIASAISTVKIA